MSKETQARVADLLAKQAELHIQSQSKVNADVKRLAKNQVNLEPVGVVAHPAIW